MQPPDAAAFLASLSIILLSAKIFGELAERCGQPAALGELLGGVFLGLGVVHFFDPGDPALGLMSELGVILLLFQTGLNSDLFELLRAGPASLAVAAVGIALPFLGGYGLMSFLGRGGMEAVFIAASMTATSVGITARILGDLGKLDRAESQLILGAAVIDDILGIVILSAVQGVASSGAFSWTAAGRTALLACCFPALALWLGPRFSRRLVAVVQRMRVRGVLIVSAIVFAFLMALAARAAGTALIVGAFAAGLVLARTDKREDIVGSLKPVADIFVPIFFVMVGAHVRLDSYNPFVPAHRGMILLAVGLTVVAVAGKALSGWAAWGGKLNRLGIGVGMVPRGEVGLIFAQVGLAAGVIGPELYAAVVAMVVFTTFLAPPLIKRAFA